MHLIIRATIQAVLVISAAVAISAADQPTITIFAAASTTDVIQAIAGAYEASNHVKVVYSFASSSTLAKQIEQGAPADLFLSADEKWMDELEDHHSIVPTSRVDLMGNQLVLIEPLAKHLTISVIKGFDIGSAFTGRLAIGDPTNVPCGIYAKQAFLALGWWDGLKDRLAPTLDVRAALRLIEIGESDLAVVYETDAQASSKVAVVATIPDNLHDPIRYPIAVTMTAKPGAAAFLSYLQSPPARAILTSAGFTMLAGQPTVK
jgi:molybdate transport system substrate-binding protein